VDFRKPFGCVFELQEARLCHVICTLRKDIMASP
jgi:hypothetical protein